jgi:hypothetical protein
MASPGRTAKEYSDVAEKQAPVPAALFHQRLMEKLL